MAHVLVLAEDECIRFTCTEVLKRFGFRASMGTLRDVAPDELPDVVLMWEPEPADAMAAVASFRPIPVLVFTWDRRQLWPEGVRVVRPPFHPERLAIVLHQASQQAASARRTCAPGREAAASCAGRGAL